MRLYWRYTQIPEFKDLPRDRRRALLRHWRSLPAQWKWFIPVVVSAVALAGGLIQSGLSVGLMIVVIISTCSLIHVWEVTRFARDRKFLKAFKHFK